MTTSEAQRILAAIDRDAMITLAQELVAIPSFKTEETEVARYIAGYLRERGYDVQLQEVEPGRFQTVAILKGAGGGRSLMLNGHIDIDPLAMGWKRDPWTPQIEGDRIYGGGIRNMKAGVASMIGAAEAVRRSGVRLKGDLVLACVVGELQGGVGTSYLCGARASPGHGGGAGALRRRQRADGSRWSAGDGHPHHRQLQTRQPDGGGGGRHRENVARPSPS